MKNNSDNEIGKIIGKNESKVDPTARISGRKSKDVDKSTEDKTDDQSFVKLLTDVTDKIAKATKEKGLKSLPDNFGDSDGDWKIIESEDFFKVLYLDFRQYLDISPEVVKKNYELIYNFWRGKKNSYDTGQVQIRENIENKYGKNNIQNCLKKLNAAYEKLSTFDQISLYFEHLTQQRISQCEILLKDVTSIIMGDEVITKEEITQCISIGEKSGFTKDEISFVLLKEIESRNFLTDEKVKGETSFDKLLSVSAWMTLQKLEEKKKQDEEKKLLEVEVLPGKYAITLDDFGQILFDNPVEAKEIINDDLLKASISQKNIVLAKEIGSITKNTKNLDLAYLKIIYRLKHNLPFRFSETKLVNNIDELCLAIFENEHTIKAGKEFFKNSSIEIWLEQTDKEAYEKLIGIRDNSANFDLAFLDMIYTFNPSLPYRLNENAIIQSPPDIYTEANKNINNWNTVKKDLFDFLIPLWMQKKGYNEIVDKWIKIENNFSANKDIGLEEFFHLIDENLEYPKITCDKTALSFPHIQSGDTIKVNINIQNTTRGYTHIKTSLKKNIQGVSFSSDKSSLNHVDGVNNISISLIIDSASMAKGKNFETALLIKTSAYQNLEIPISFKLIFPIREFLKESFKYMVIFAGIFALLRTIVSTKYPDWLKNTLNLFIDWQTAVNNSNYELFGYLFFSISFLTFMSIILIFKYKK